MKSNRRKRIIAPPRCKPLATFTAAQTNLLRNMIEDATVDTGRQIMTVVGKLFDAQKRAR